MAERCDVCEANRDHEISIELMTESPRQETSVYGREPYRVATCLDCGTTTQIRMNHV